MDGRKFLISIGYSFSLKDNDDLASESGLGGQYDNKRALHNAMERKRRDSIKDSFRGQLVYVERFLFNKDLFVRVTRLHSDIAG